MRRATELVVKPGVSPALLPFYMDQLVRVDVTGPISQIGARMFARATGARLGITAFAEQQKTSTRHVSVHRAVRYQQTIYDSVGLYGVWFPRPFMDATLAT